VSYPVAYRYCASSGKHTSAYGRYVVVVVIVVVVVVVIVVVLSCLQAADTTKNRTHFGW